MPNKFSRTEIVGGESVVTLFATGLNCIERQIAMLEELVVNNKSCEEICGPAEEARDALALLKARVNMPKARSDSTTTPETVEKAPVTKPPTTEPLSTPASPAAADALNS